jgi:hypothetical protein
MSAFVVITPIITAAWPVLSGAIFGAAAALGFSLNNTSSTEISEKKSESVELEIKNSSIVTDSLEKQEEAVFTREGVTVAFKKDLSGHCAISVSGVEKSRQELREIGSELSQKVVQMYVHARVVDELRRKGFELAEEEVTEDRTIRLTVRRWK